MPSLLLSLAAGSLCAAASPPVPDESARPAGKQGAILEITEENDFFVNKDRHYTQGFRINYLGPDDRMPEWMMKCANGIPAVGFEVKANKLGGEVGQSIFTPANTETAQLVPDDRPYAGWLYTGVALQRRGLSQRGRIPILENFHLQAGVIGPEALGENAQNWAHQVLGQGHSQGWDNQLKTEPGLALRYQRAWLFTSNSRNAWGLDLIPHAGASLGNVDTSLRAGAMVRLGWHLPDDFGPQIIDSPALQDGGRSPYATNRRWGVYLFAGAEGRVVGYNAFLDGNLYQHSHHVEKKPLVGDLKAGVAFILDRFEVGFQLVYRSKEFETQHQDDAFGSLSLKYMF